VGRVLQLTPEEQRAGRVLDALVAAVTAILATLMIYACLVIWR